MLRWMLGILALSLGLLAVTDAAWAWYAYRVDVELFAIRCRDNKTFLFHGTINQLEHAGDVLCKDHGGLAGPGGGPQVVPAPAEIRALVAAGCTPGPIRGSRQCGRAPHPKGPGKKPAPAAANGH